MPDGNQKEMDKFLEDFSLKNGCHFVLLNSNCQINQVSVTFKLSFNHICVFFLNSSFLQTFTLHLSDAVDRHLPGGVPIQQASEYVKSAIEEAKKTTKALHEEDGAEGKIEQLGHAFGKLSTDFVKTKKDSGVFVEDCLVLKEDFKCLFKLLKLLNPYAKQ